MEHCKRNFQRKEIKMVKIGIDVGNFNVKDSNGMIFESGYTVSDTEPVSMDNTFVMDGKYYTFGKRLPVDMKKNENGRAWISSIPCIANAILQDSKYQPGKVAKVKVGVGIPAGLYGAEKEKTRNTYMDNGKGPVKVIFRNTEIAFIIEEAYVFPQGVSAYIAKSPELREFDYLNCIDIGGYTVEVTPVMDYKINPSDCFSLEFGTIFLINRIRDRLFEMNITLSDSQICKVMVTGCIRHMDSKTIINLIDEEKERYVYELKQMIAERKVDLRIPVCTQGGGSALLKKDLDNQMDCVAHYGSFVNADSYLKLMNKRA